MSDEDRTIRAAGGMAGSVVTNTVLFARAHGVSIDALQQATGLSPAQLVALDGRYPEDLVARVWCLLLDAHPGRALPLEMASAAPFSFFGPLAHGARFASDMRAALESLVRYQRILSDALRTELVDDPPQIRLSHPTDALDRGAGAEVGVALGSRFCREVLGATDAIVGVDLAHAPIGPRAAYDAHFGVPVRFERPHTALCFAPGALDAPLPTPDPTLWSFIQQHLDLAHAQLAPPDALAEVRAAIAENAARGEFSTQALARRMGMSLRVLQRLTAQHGERPKAMIDRARIANARQLLTDRRLSVEEVAFLLAYSDERAFRRAFKRLTGESPAQYRRGLR